MNKNSLPVTHSMRVVAILLGCAVEIFQLSANADSRREEVVPWECGRSQTSGWSQGAIAA